MELAIHETESGELVELWFRFIPDKQHDWIVREGWDGKIDFSDDESVCRSLETELVILDRRIIMHHASGERFMARLGFSIAEKCFLISKYAQVAKDGIINLE